ncbi:MAG: S8 family serine peptidase [Nonomuraea sp.]|nr:S8 family serine peptidase [Nonomuraea sp.]NUP61981.1 S8 family serine peptidase [Nonomuraea sp.]NUP84070.1 S8 family serine peptidase [Nonomuraea sp.]NUS06738.1 S8 family serine peptidase [Nonomuraea sp.]NUT09819.1 S8 family serine peptidase [Nonomuraea sp.]
MRLRSLLAGATALAATSAVLCAAPALRADALDTGDPVISPALVKEIKAKTKVRSIIQLKPGQSVQAVAKDLEQASEGSRVLETAQSPNFFVAELDSKTLAQLKKDGRVQAVYKDELRPATLDTSTRVIRSDRANEAGWTGKGTTVAVLDTGIDRDHPFFTGRIVDEACFSSSDAGDGSVSLCPNNQPSQTGVGAANAETPQCMVNGANACSHGSHVAGIAAGRMTTGAPSDGVAPAANILPIQVFSRIDSAITCAISGASAPCFLSYTSDQKLALEYVARVARNLHVAAVNMSLGGGGPFQENCDTDPSAAAVKPDFDTLVSLGVAPVVAAGNNGFLNGVSAPACISSAIAVGATDDRDAIAAFSNRGAVLDLFAPGVDINSSVPNNTYAVFSGTSMAAPHVAGAFALMRQAYPDFTVAQSLRRMQDTGQDVTYNAGGAQVTTDRIDMSRATSAARATGDPRV